jgi:hypothetical protein
VSSRRAEWVVRVAAAAVVELIIRRAGACLVHRLHECAGDVLGYLQAQTCLRTALDIHEQRHASALANRVRTALASLTGQPE